MWVWPLRNRTPLLPDYPGQFGSTRSLDVHTGVDLYCELGTEVVAVEGGIVVDTPHFTGQYVLTEAGEPSSWWNDTQAVLVEGASGVVVYGELGPTTIRVKAGDRVEAGALLGVVDVAVLRSFKGRPMVMLHFELMTPGARETVWWCRSDTHTDTDAHAGGGGGIESEQMMTKSPTRPPTLLDPSDLLLATASSSGSEGTVPQVFELSTYDGQSFVDPKAPHKPSIYWQVWGGAPNGAS